MTEPSKTSTDIMMATQLSELKNSTTNLEKDIAETQAKIAALGTSVDAVKTQLTSSVRNSVVAAVGFVSALAAIGAILGFGSIDKLREQVDETTTSVQQSVTALDTTVKDIPERVAQSTGGLTEEMAALKSTIGEISGLVDKLGTDMAALQEDLVQSSLGFSENTQTIREAITGLEREIATLSAEVRQLDVEPGGAGTGNFSAGTSTDQLFIQLRAALKTNNLRDAMRVANTLYELRDQSSPYEIATLATAFFKARQYDKVVVLSREGLQKIGTPETRTEKFVASTLNSKIGDVFVKSKDYDKAVNAYAECLAIVPGSVPCLNNQASVLIRLKRFGEACAQLDKASGLEKNLDQKASILNNLAFCHLESSVHLSGQDQAEALNAAQAAVNRNIDVASKIVPTNRERQSNAQFVNALALGLRDEWLDAQKAMDEAKRLSPTAALALPNSGRIEDFVGRMVQKWKAR